MHAGFLNNFKIKSKLVFIYFTITSLTLIAIGSYFTVKMSSLIISDTEKDAAYTLNQVKQRFEDNLNMAVKTASIIYNDEKLHDIASKSYSDYNDNISAYKDYEIINNYLKYYTSFSDIRLYVENDNILDNYYIRKVTDEIKNEEWYREAVSKNGAINWVYSYDSLTRKNTLSLTRLIKCSRHKDVGILMLSIDSASLNQIIKESRYEVSILLDDKIVASNSYAEGENLKSSINSEDAEMFKPSTKTQESEEKYTISEKYKLNPSSANTFEILVSASLKTKMKPWVSTVTKSAGIISAAMIISLIIIKIFSNTFAERIKLLKAEMDKVVKGDFNIKKEIDGKDEINAIYSDFRIMVESIEDLIDEVYVKEIERNELIMKQQDLLVAQKDAELKMLASQINPHFLYNTLETIRMRAFCSGDRELAGIVKKLGKIMRRTLESTYKIVTFESELDFTESYLEIQKLRHEGKIDYEFKIEEDTRKCTLLPLLMQPVVENALIHGMEGSTVKGRIVITSLLEDDNLIIKIEDNGCGIDEEVLNNIKEHLKMDATEDADITERKSIGIVNVNQRIRLYYGKDYGLAIESVKGRGTKAVLKLPKLLKKGDKEND